MIWGVALNCYTKELQLAIYGLLMKYRGESLLIRNLV